jgi:hypothetical protein
VLTRSGIDETVARHSVARLADGSPKHVQSRKRHHARSQRRSERGRFAGSSRQPR